MIKNISGFFFLLAFAYVISLSAGGCAQISAPTGGPKDTIAPKLEKAQPANRTTNFTGNKITLTFDEYINVENISENVLVSPLQKSNPIISFNFKTVTVRLRDTLLPNTTYSIDFGNALKDLNENNPFENFTYTFSTGDAIDSFALSGRVLQAETGKIDSTFIATLYRDLSDSAVKKKRPLYIAKVKGDGSFTFNNLPAGRFNLYALKDGDGSKTYNAKTEGFAFLDSSVEIGAENPPLTLMAYEEVKASRNAPAVRALPEKRLRYKISLEAQRHDILQPLELTFNNPIKNFDENRIVLLDTNFAPVQPTSFIFDSTRTQLQISTNWLQGYDYALVLPKDAIKDSAENNLFSTDTVFFTTTKVEDYGSVVLRFKNVNLNKNPVVQFVRADEVKFSFALTTNEWSGKTIKPGEYELRILFDTNGNGRWDAGDLEKKTQPETAISLKQTLAVRANWDNELDIDLGQ